jgi:hypothetical protein
MTHLTRVAAEGAIQRIDNRVTDDEAEADGKGTATASTGMEVASRRIVDTKKSVGRLTPTVMVGRTGTESALQA